VTGIPFGRYRLLKRIARGGMAEVFLAELHGAEGFQRRVAIKRILPHLSDSDEFRAMFMDEARLAALLAHPNVVHIYDFGREGDHYFIAMELVDGISLSQLIHEASRRPLPFEHVARISADVCAGLHYAHHLVDGGRPLGLVHRDVSPQNILVTWDGVVKLVDFGIAKAAWQAERTRPGMVKGKWTYMSPEQCEGRKLDGRSDLFSLGTVMYELLTGEPRYRRDDAERAMREIRDGKPLDVERFRPDAPPELVQVVRRATSVVRDGRFATAGEMQLHLERFLASRRAPTTSHLLGEFLRKTYPRDEMDEGIEEGTPAQVEAAADETVPIEVAPAATEVVSAARPRGRWPVRAALAVSGIALVCAVGWFSWKRWPRAKAEPKAVNVVQPKPIETKNEPIKVIEPPKKTLFDLATRPAGAKVIVDGVVVKRATPLTDEEIAPGRHSLAIALPSFERRTMDLEIAQGEKRTIELEMKPIKVVKGVKAQPGYLTVRTIPWSQVYEGTRLLGTTPLANVPLLPGSHTLTFVNPERPTVKRAVAIKAGQEKRVALELPR